MHTYLHETDMMQNNFIPNTVLNRICIYLKMNDYGLCYTLYNFVKEYAEEVTDGQQSCRSYVCFAENCIATEVSLNTAHAQIF